MNKSKLLISTFIIFLFAFSFSVKAQNNLGEDAAEKPVQRGNLMRMLGLSRDQIQQIRLLNSARKPLEREAVERIEEAKQNLDKAVYADSLNESEIQTRLSRLQQAQAELIKIKAMHELEIRKILTAEQLVKFREIRQEFDERRKSRIKRRQNRRTDAPNIRRNNRQRP